MAMAFRRTKGLEFQSHTGRELEIQKDLLQMGYFNAYGTYYSTELAF